MTAGTSLPRINCLNLDLCPQIIFAAHLDVPEGVFVSSRAEALALVEPCHSADVVPRVFAGVPLPVKRELVQAGVPQYHLGIDTGSSDCAGGSCSSASARMTIGVYNSAAVMANATIEIRRGCDDAVMERRNVTIPANSVIHFGGFLSETDALPFPPGTTGCFKAPFYAIYAVVTIDQPSFSYAISLRNDMPPKFAGVAPVTQ